MTDAHEHTDSETEVKTVVTLPSSKMATSVKVTQELLSRTGKKKLSHGDLMRMKNQMLLNTTLEAS